MPERQSCKQSVEDKFPGKNITWREAIKKTSKNRVWWRSTADTLCSPGGEHGSRSRSKDSLPVILTINLYYINCNWWKKKRTNLAIIPSSCNKVSILGITHSVHIMVVTLLFQYVCFTLPFPNQQLTHVTTSKCKPFTTIIDSHCFNGLLWNAVKMS